MWQAEAICTGSLAGHNAVRYLLGMPLLVLPKTTAIGDIISYANYKMMSKKGRRNRYTFAGAEYFKRMQDMKLYSTNREEIKSRIEGLNLVDIMNQKFL